MTLSKLLAHLTGRDASCFLTLTDQRASLDQLGDGERQWVEKSLEALEADMPLSRVLGTREFWSLPFGLNEATLDPRCDSEILVELALQWVRAAQNCQALRILDLGTGSGCLILSLLSELPMVQGVGVDKSARALEQAQKNAQALGLSERVQWVQGEWFEPVLGSFDLIISNPPYIPSKVIPTLDKTVELHDPVLALDGGEDGLQCYREILKSLPSFLREKGAVFLEIGTPDQVEPVESLLKRARLTLGPTGMDLENRPRVVWGKISS